MTTVTISREEYDALKLTRERYEFLRNPSHIALYGSESTPIVIDREGALHRICGPVMDTRIDEERLCDMVNFLHHRNRVNGDFRYADPNYQFSDRYTNRLTKIAIRLLKGKINYPLIRAMEQEEKKRRKGHKQ